MTSYVAFLRGINIGKRQVKMEELQAAFQALGFEAVRTYIASGNVVFEALEQDSATLTKKIEQKLAKQFGFDISVMLRSLSDLQKLVKANPFSGAEPTPGTKQYVTFLTEHPKVALKTPYKDTDKTFTILSVSNSQVFSLLTLSPGTGTTDLMKFLEKQFGKNITTRNWDTLMRLAPIQP